VKRYLITFSYDGSDFNGYQRQPKLRTVQGEIEKVLKSINNNQDVEIQASGRTDAKVHAINQKAHFDLSVTITDEKLKMALNSYLPDDIYVKSVEKADNNFHARYMVKAKEYIYKINLGEYNPLERNYEYQYNKRLDLVEIERALKYLEGEHDFTTFACKEDLKENTIRTILQTNLIRDTKDPNKIILSFLGTGFLKYQVRNMVGTLIEIGEGKKKSEDMKEL
jgi:tRNA pseudouridine38-40 synthase